MDNMDENGVAESAGKFLIDEFGQFFYQTHDGSQYAVTVSDANVIIDNQVLQNQEAGKENIPNFGVEEADSKSVEMVQKQLFKCNDCDYTTEKKQLLKQHGLKHSDDRPHKCTICGKSFKSMPSLQIHGEIHKGYKPFQCNDCSATFVLSKELRRHVQYKHTKEKPHKCTTCDYACVESSKLRRHVRIHTGEKPYTCDQCSYASPDSFKLQRHMRVHTGEKPYKCEICEACFTQSNSRKKHMKLHAENKITFQCELCPSNYSRIEDLRIHTAKQHFFSKHIQCNFCREVFLDRYTYMKHKKSHKGEKPYKCRICSYAVTTANRLENHMNSKHFKKETFAYDQCDKKYSQNNPLSSHQELDPSQIVKNHKCLVCNKVYKQFARLQNHMAKHNFNLEKSQVTLEFPGVFEIKSPNVNNVTEYLRMTDNDNQSRVLDNDKPKFGIENSFGFDEDIEDEI